MNDEIKEILDNLKNKDNDIKGINFLKYQDLTRGEINLLLDYITNLQQENERLQENNSNMQEEMARVWEENERLKEEHNQLRNCRKYDLNLISNLKHDKVRYEEIIDKAIEYIKFEWEKIVEDECYENHLWSVDGLVIKRILNILQNGSDSQC